MTREFFNRQFAALVSAYTIAQRLSDESQDVYWEMLQNIPMDRFGAGVKKCLARCKFFPTIAELGDASMPAKTILSSHWVQTRNGMDRLPEHLGWEVQVEEMQAERIKSNNRERKRIGE